MRHEIKVYFQVQSLSKNIRAYLYNFPLRRSFNFMKKKKQYVKYFEILLNLKLRRYDSNNFQKM